MNLHVCQKHLHCTWKSVLCTNTNEQSVDISKKMSVKYKKCLSGTITSVKGKCLSVTITSVKGKCLSVTTTSVKGKCLSVTTTSVKEKCLSTLLCVHMSRTTSVKEFKNSAILQPQVRREISRDLVL